MPIPLYPCPVLDCSRTILLAVNIDRVRGSPSKGLEVGLGVHSDSDICGHQDPHPTSTHNSANSSYPMRFQYRGTPAFYLQVRLIDRVLSLTRGHEIMSSLVHLMCFLRHTIQKLEFRSSPDQQIAKYEGSQHILQVDNSWKTCAAEAPLAQWPRAHP